MSTHQFEDERDAVFTGLCARCGRLYSDPTHVVPAPSPTALHLERARWRDETGHLWTIIDRLRAENDRLRAAETEARQGWRAESHDISEQAHTYRLRAEAYESEVVSLRIELDAEQRMRTMSDTALRSCKIARDALEAERDLAREAERVARRESKLTEPQKCPADCQHRCHHTTSQEVFAQELSMAWDMIRDLRVQLAKVMTEGR